MANMIPNPEFTINTTGWSVIGAGSMARTTADFNVSPASLDVLTSTDFLGVAASGWSLGDHVGQTWVGSAWVKAKTGADVGKSIDLIMITNGPGEQFGTSFVLTATWQYISQEVRWTQSGGTSLRMDFRATDAVATAFFLDSVSAEEVMTYDSAVLADAPVVYYNMDQASGSLIDSSGNSNLGNIGPATPRYQLPGPIFSDPPSNFAVGFSGDDYYQPNNSASISSVVDVFTAEAWVRRAAIGVTGTIFHWGSNALHVRIMADNTVQLSNGDVADIVNSNTTITDTLWHYIVVTKNGATVRIYIDAVDRTGSVSNSTMTGNSGDRFIGSSYIPSQFMVGDMARLAVYATALSAARVLVHYRLAAAILASSTPNFTAGRGAC